MLLVYLLTTKKISAHMSSYQILRLALHFLGKLLQLGHKTTLYDDIFSRRNVFIYL